MGVLAKEKIYGKIVEVRKKCDRVMAIVLTLSREVMQVIRAYGHKAENQTQRKFVFVIK